MSTANKPVFTKEAESGGQSTPNSAKSHFKKIHNKFKDKKSNKKEKEENKQVVEEDKKIFSLARSASQKIKRSSSLTSINKEDLKSEVELLLVLLLVFLVRDGIESSGG